MSRMLPVFAIVTGFVRLSLWSWGTFSVSVLCSPQFLRIMSLSGSFLCQPVSIPLVTLTAFTVSVIVILSTVLSILLLLLLFLSFETSTALFL